MKTPKNDSKESKAKADEKASAINKPDTKSEIDSNIQAKRENKEIPSVEEIFTMSTDIAKRFIKSQEIITELKTEIAELKKTKAMLSQRIRPISRVLRKINPDGIVFESISSQDRKAIRHEINLIKNKLLLKNEALRKEKANFDDYSAEVEKDMKKTELINKAQSVHWTKRNRWSVEAKLIRFLNNLRTNYMEDLTHLIECAKSEERNEKIIFNEELKSVLDKVDAETSILCSSILKNELYEAVRLTIKNVDPESILEFTTIALLPKQ